MFIKRLFSLIGGKLSRWLKSREMHDPEAVYEAAITDRVRRYQHLKSAAAGVIYMRNKLRARTTAKVSGAYRGIRAGSAGGGDERRQLRALADSAQA